LTLDNLIRYTLLYLKKIGKGENMARERLSMRKIKEILRLKSLGFSSRKIALSVKISRSTVAEYIERAQKANIIWPLPEDLADEKLKELLFGDEEEKPRLRTEPDYAYMHKELKRKGVTLSLLWKEYLSFNPDGYRYSQYCQLYRDWQGAIDPSMRLDHKAGEKCFIDYAGMTMPVTDIGTGEIRQAQIFVAALGASSYTYAEATLTQELHNFISSHVRAFSFFGGVSEILVPDNPKQGVTKPCYYDPDINPTYQDMAMHYSVAVIPARIRTPKDKAKVESAVQVVERWILAPLRNRTFFSLSELNEAIAELLTKLNESPFQKLDGSRKSTFLEIEKAALGPLPLKPYEFAAWKKAKVSIDYHIDVKGSYYSVPCKLIGKKLDVRFTATTIEIFNASKRVASHKRLNRKGAYSTNTEHMPKAHQEYLKWTPERIVSWAKEIGGQTSKLAKQIMESKPHPQQGFRACLGIIRLSNRYGSERVEAASRRALATGATRYRSVESILKTGLDKIPLEEQAIIPVLNHENLRGPNYYR
jgi:transposase